MVSVNANSTNVRGVTYSAYWTGENGKIMGINGYLRTSDLIADAKAMGATPAQVKEMREQAVSARKRAKMFVRR